MTEEDLLSRINASLAAEEAQSSGDAAEDEALEAWLNVAGLREWTSIEGAITSDAG